MDSTDQAASGPEPTTPTPPEGDATPTPGAPNAAPVDPKATDGGQAPPEPKAADGDDQSYKAKIEAANREAATYRRKLREAEEALQAKNDAELSDLERANKRAEEAESLAQARESELRTARVANAVTAEAARLRFRDPADAMAFVPEAELEFDDDGYPTNAAALVAKIASERGYLIQPATSPSSTGAPASGPEREESFDEKRRRIFGGSRSGSAWDSPERHGGGVIASPGE